MTSLKDHVIIDQWEKILQSMNPEYFKLKDMLEEGPEFIARKTKLRLVEIFEVWPDGRNSSHLMSGDYLILDDIVDSVAEELKKWPGVKRAAWNQWAFKNSQDADKFITWYNLKWRK